MSGFYVKGETKERPGIYKRIENITRIGPVGAREGVGAAVVTGTWGPLNEAHIVTNGDDYVEYVGTGKGYDTVKEMFAGGVRTAVVVRVGEGGSNASVTLAATRKGISDTEIPEAAVLTARYPGSRRFSVSIRKNLDNALMKDIIIYEGTKELEKASFKIAQNDVDGMKMALAKSKYVTVEVKTNNCSMNEITQKALTGGKDPTVTNESYSAGFEAANMEIFDSLCVDTDDREVHALIAEFVDRIYEAGDYPLATISESEDVDLEDKMAHASAYNNEKIHYVLNGWTDAYGNKHQGYLAAARIAGMIAAVSSNESLTHRDVDGAVSIINPLTNKQIISALKAGCIVISKSKSSNIMIEKGINTLVSPPANKDNGWKKIRRVKTRFELMDRIDRTLEPMIGKVNNDPDGRAAIIAAGQALLDAMIGEGKLLTGAEFLLDEGNPPAGDSAWFIIRVDDIDSFEIGYLTYQFRFAPEAETEE